MSVFFDTNILIYAQQQGAGGDIARQHLARGGALSVQVLNEFTNVSVKKYARSWDEIEAAVDDVLALVSTPAALTLETHKAARALARTHRLSFHDALIVAAALKSGCTTLLSEDLQHGRKFGELEVINPFANGPA